MQIQRMTGVSYKSALFMMHRVRWAMGGGNGGGKLDGIVEVDETYVGGKKRKGQRRVGRPSPREKAPVVALVERGGRVRVSHVADVTARTLGDAVRENVAAQARVMTDEFNATPAFPAPATFTRRSATAPASMRGATFIPTPSKDSSP